MALTVEQIETQISERGCVANIGQIDVASKIAQALGTRNWVVAARWTPALRARYSVRLSQNQFAALREELSA